ncbi:hypothetical protein [Paenibacillus sp. IHBB 10380]|uniref:hypothetical protein n=1 Tax=Paenibacillus sp. IHBB 10380 TaxID=1566358 RepID=UPI0005CFB030|nr:hypothetical protein [Paenibacillus sp. IHBB 10380]AJS57720.1 hypothetical protein UB51_03545 [Paenibacillus sp. IHBB 10380]
MDEHKKDREVKHDESIHNEDILHKKGKNRVDYPRLNHNHEEEYAAEVAPLPVRGRESRVVDDAVDKEEYAAEVAPLPVRGRESRSVDDAVDEDIDVDGKTGTMAGYIGLAVGIAALFMWSIVLGPIAAVTGLYAYSQGSKTTGAWSMGLGILATISYFVLIPFAR